MLAKFLALVNVGKMNLDCGQPGGKKCVANGHTRVGVGRGIDQNAIKTIARLPDQIHDFALMIGLDDFKPGLKPAGFALKIPINALDGHMPVDFNLPLSEQLKIGPMDDEDFFHLFGFARMGCRLRLFGLIDQHDRNTVTNRIAQTALRILANDFVPLLAHRGLALGTGQDFQQCFIDGHSSFSIS